MKSYLISLLLLIPVAAYPSSGAELRPGSQFGENGPVLGGLSQNGSETVSPARLIWKVKIGDEPDSLAQAKLSAAGDEQFRYRVGSIAESAPAIGPDGTIYLGSGDGRLYAVNRDGSYKWSYRTGDYIGSNPSVGSDGTIYFGSNDKYFYALKSDGTLKWRYKTEGEVYSSPALGRDGTIYFGSQDSYIYALNANGSLKWRYKTLREVQYSPAIGSDETIFFGSHDGGVYALNPDGSLKWRYQIYSIRTSPAIGADGTIYFGDYDNKLYALNPDGTQKWWFITNGEVQSSPAIGRDGTLYFGSDDNTFRAVRPNGSSPWSWGTNNHIISSPALGRDGSIYFAVNPGWDNAPYLFCIDSDGLLKWQFKLAEGGDVSSSPAIDDQGILYVGSPDGNLYAIDTGAGAGLADSPWPKFHRDLRNSGHAPEVNLYPNKLEIYNLRGQVVNTLVDKVREPGEYQVYWDGLDSRGREVSSGVFFYRLRAGAFTQARKMVVLR